MNITWRGFHSPCSLAFTRHGGEVTSLCVSLENRRCSHVSSYECAATDTRIVLRRAGKSCLPAQCTMAIRPMNYTVVYLLINCALVFRAANKARRLSPFDYRRRGLGAKQVREKSSRGPSVHYPLKDTMSSLLPEIREVGEIYLGICLSVIRRISFGNSNKQVEISLFLTV